jgi:hypothetical protein
MDEFNVVAAFLEQYFGVRRLEVVDADFGAWDMSGDGEYGNAASMAVKEAVDQVQVSRAATSTADRELPRQMRLDTGGEGCAFLMLAR